MCRCRAAARMSLSPSPTMATAFISSICPARESSSSTARRPPPGPSNPRGILMRRTLLLLALAGLVALGSLAPASADDADTPTKSDDVVLIVMDPMALELSCPCVKGYAQRNYNKLGAFL